MDGRLRRFARRRISLLALVLLLSLFVAGCGKAGQTTSTVTTPTTTLPPVSLTTTSTEPASSSTSLSTTTTPRATTTSSLPTSTSLASIDTPTGAILLSPAQLAGQRVIYSYSGLTPPPALLSLIRKGEAAGVIFFKDNIASPAQISSVTAELERANDSSSNPVRAPLLLMTDQEGGAIRRLQGAPLLSEKQIGASDNPVREATNAGAGAGTNLKGVGMNVNLAPVLDVYRQAGDFDDRFGRSYSTDPQVVSDLGAAFVAAQQEVGVAATAKHFPGLGAATAKQDTDLAPVTLRTPLATLRSVDEAPYRAAIAAGVRLIMVSWATYPALDPSLPAGLSPKVVQGELRDRLKFQRVTITDGMGTDALKAFGGFGQRAVRAAQAGMDLMLCSAATTQAVPQGDAARKGLAAGYLDGSLNKVAFRQAVERVVGLRYGLAQ